MVNWRTSTLLYTHYNESLCDAYTCNEPYILARALEEANEWESEGYKVSVYAGNAFAQFMEKSH